MVTLAQNNFSATRSAHYTNLLLLFIAMKITFFSHDVHQSFAILQLSSFSTFCLAKVCVKLCGQAIV